MQYRLINSYPTDSIIKTILLNRGINNPEQYLNLTSECCNDYKNLTNIDKAV